jgi:hypothetical protein
MLMLCVDILSVSNVVMLIYSMYFFFFLTFIWSCIIL